MTTEDPINHDNTTSRSVTHAINGFVFANAKTPHRNIPYTW